MENPIKHGMIWGGKNPYLWFNTHMHTFLTEKEMGIKTGTRL